MPKFKAILYVFNSTTYILGSYILLWQHSQQDPVVTEAVKNYSVCINDTELGCMCSDSCAF